jgi:hypothetical protein
LFLSRFLNKQLQKFNTCSRPVLLILDEAPRLRDRIDLPGLRSLAASANMSVVLAVQEVNNFREDERDVIFANCGTWVLMGRRRADNDRVLRLPGGVATSRDFPGHRSSIHYRWIVHRCFIHATVLLHLRLLAWRRE